MKALKFLLSISIGTHPRRQGIFKMLIESFDLVSNRDGTSLRAMGLANESMCNGYCTALNDMAALLDAVLESDPA